MKYIFLIGGSGTGKTTLAKRLEEFCPEKYKRTLELSTRTIRDGEINGDDYKFVSDSEFEKLLEKGLFESVEHQFYPSRYGAEFEELDSEKWNIVIVCIEGFMSAIKHVRLYDKAVLINIISDTNLDISREGRNPQFEENINKAVLKNIFADDPRVNNIKYVELFLSTLKNIRNSKDDLLAYFDDILDNN